MLFTLKENARNSEDLLRIIESNCRKATAIRNSIDSFKNFSLATDTSFSHCLEDKSISMADEKEKPLIIEDFDYYLELYRLLDAKATKEDLLGILPDRDDYDFDNIVIRLQAEAVKEMKEINELISEEGKIISKEELEELRTALETEKLKKRLLADISVKDKAPVLLEKEENKIILVPTSAGNIKLLDELLLIPIEYRTSFLELINSIIDGTFKNFKRFTSHDYFKGVCEVRGFKTRVLFERVGKNSYALISAFIKKVDNTSGYREYLKVRIGEYRMVQERLKEKLDDEEFMQNNDFYVQELFNILKSKDKNKNYKKGGLND